MSIEFNALLLHLSSAGSSGQKFRDSYRMESKYGKEKERGLETYGYCRWVSIVTMEKE